ncbi:hypothetical protein [Thiobacillus sp.]|uniref:hypothetical protein n=1 Tax=Thiobacillus sp. TaxID=924 RepID=UPI0025DD54D8|nr:hypothetical protein [Thiobacillus sp.]
MGHTERAMIAYAVLKHQLASADLYEGLMVFFRPVTSSLAGRLFVPSELATELVNRYALRVPALVLESLVERMSNAGLIRKRTERDRVASYEYVASDDIVTNASLPKITDLLDRFKEFARKQSSELSELSDASLDDALFDRLVRIESLEILSRRDGLEVPKHTARTITLRKKDVVTTDDKSQIDLHLDYVVPRFILALTESDAEGFDLLNDIASANLAAETLLTYREPPRRGEALDEFDLYLDAPLCLDILGVNPGREEYGQQLSQELKRAGCRVYVFLHSISEIERVLDARKQSYLSGITPFDRYQVDPPRVRDLVNALVGHTEQVLIEQFGFQVIDSAAAIPAGRRASVGAEEEKAIRDQLVGWKNADGREVDVATCCDLIRMRSGMDIQTRIQKAGAILATRNAVLARAANATWKTWLTGKNKGSRERIRNAAPLAILDKQLVGLLWITQGGQAGSIGRAHLVANCAAAIATRKDVITRVYNTLLETSEQSAKIFSALINDQRAERALMDTTFGDPDVITDESVLPLLEKVRMATAQEVESAKNKEIIDLTSAFRQRNGKLAEKAAQLGLERDSAVAMRVAAEERVSDLERAERRRKEKLIFRSFKHARYVYIAAVVGISFILGLLTYAIQRVLISDLAQPVLSGVWAQVQQFGIPGIITAFSGLGLAWDIPELIGGRVRNQVSETAFRLFAERNDVSALLEEYVWDFKANTIKPQQRPAADESVSS